jgi:hypothetical protein
MERYLFFILMALYIGAIITAFNQRWSTALAMLYMGGLVVTALVGIGWFLFIIVASDPVGTSPRTLPLESELRPLIVLTS